MARVAVLILFGLTVFSLLVVRSMPVASQQSQFQSQLNTVIEDVRKAESAGAEPQELAGLINELNSVVGLESQLQNLSPQEADKRSQLLGEISSRLAHVDAEANQVQVSASQRTLTNHLIAYVFGGVEALLATLVSCWTLSLWRKCRAKRFLQLKIVPK